MPEDKSSEKKITHKNIYEALSAFQGEMKPIDQTKEVKFKAGGGEVNFKYAPLGDIMKEIYVPLARHGLSVRHEVSDGVEAVLTHETSEYKEVDNLTEKGVVVDNDGTITTESRVASRSILEKGVIRSGKIPVKLDGDMKTVGGNITYARRYTLGLVLGLATEEDKDVELMEARKKNMESFAMKTARNNIERAQGDKLDEQISFLEKEIKIIDAGKVPSLGLSKEQYDDLLNFAKAKKTGKATEQDGGRDDEGYEKHLKEIDFQRNK